MKGSKAGCGKTKGKPKDAMKGRSKGSKMPGQPKAAFGKRGGSRTYKPTMD